MTTPSSGSERRNGPSLVVQTAFLGDVVLTTPLLQVLADRHGPVDLVTTPLAAPLLETHPAVRRVIAYDKNGKDRGPAALFGLARRLRAEGYEVAYLPHRSLRSAVLAWAAGIPRRVGFRGPWALLYTDTRARPAWPVFVWPPGTNDSDVVTTRPPQRTHEITRLLALVERTPVPRRPSLHPTAEDTAAAVGLLEESGVRGDFIALAPGSIWGSKRWPYFGQLAGWLARRAPVVAVGGPEDAPLGTEIVAAARASGGVGVNACGRLTLRQSAALIGLARLLVTNDSAPLHIASAMGTRVVALFGPTVPEFGFGPVDPRDVALGVGGLACRPCHRHGPPECPLTHHWCMRRLGSDYVEAAIEETGALHRRD
jgi:heptosyltransferase-2